MSKKKHPPGIRWDFRFMERAEPRPSEELPVFYNEQDLNGTPCSMATRYELQKLKARGEGKFVSHGKAFRLNRRGPAPPPARFSPSLSPDSTASISVAEVRANVGEPDVTPGAEIPRHIVKRAQQKIRAIGLRLEGTYDPRAVLAFGSWPVYQHAEHEAGA
jgi:hypothetical protein